ncbi:hypothetical protein FACS1894208_03170 [Clostridia bacterium]|nr:hypothetical protein FACS1894208_03170 [Clostridia bacterium]
MFKFMKSETNRLAAIFALEGAIFAAVTNLANNNNNLFAQRLGFTDTQMGLLSGLPQLVGLLVLLPGGILADRLRNKRGMLIAALCSAAALYAGIAASPFLGEYAVAGFLGLLALSAAPIAIYNMGWSAFFSDVVTIERRNGILTVKNYVVFAVGILAPLITGFLLSNAPDNGGKIALHQIFYAVAAICLVAQTFALRRVRGGDVTPTGGRNVRDYAAAAVRLARDKKFLGFVGVALFFYMTWHLDWTMYFIGEVRYIGLDEAWLAYVNVGNALVQAVTIPIWSKINNRKGARFGMIFGAIGLAMNPVAIVTASFMPAAAAKPVFLALNTLAGFALCTTSLNILQNLLEAVPDADKTLSISLYTCLITFSNMAMPMAGVQIYRALGADLQALRSFFVIVFALRAAATGLWFLRWKADRRARHS